MNLQQIDAARKEQRATIARIQAIGVAEYLRRKGLMQQQGGWFDKLEVLGAAGHGNY
jgi:hypothetical protein